MQVEGQRDGLQICGQVGNRPEKIEPSGPCQSEGPRVGLKGEIAEISSLREIVNGRRLDRAGKTQIIGATPHWSHIPNPVCGCCPVAVRSTPVPGIRGGRQRQRGNHPRQDKEEQVFQDAFCLHTLILREVNSNRNYMKG